MCLFLGVFIYNALFYLKKTKTIAHSQKELLGARNEQNYPVHSLIEINCIGTYKGRGMLKKSWVKV